MASAAAGSRKTSRPSTGRHNLRISSAAEARAYVKQLGIDAEFHKKYVGEMHNLLRTLIENEAPSTEYLRGVAVSTDNAISQVGGAESVLDGKMQ